MQFTYRKCNIEDLYKMREAVQFWVDCHERLPAKCIIFSESELMELLNLVKNGVKIKIDNRRKFTFDNVIFSSLGCFRPKKVSSI